MSQFVAPNSYAAQQSSEGIVELAIDSSATQKVVCAASLFTVFITILGFNYKNVLKIKNIKLKVAVIACLLLFVACQLYLFSTAIAEKIHKQPLKSSIGWLSITPYLILCICVFLISAAASGIK